MLLCYVQLAQLKFYSPPYRVMMAKMATLEFLANRVPLAHSAHLALLV